MSRDGARAEDPALIRHLRGAAAELLLRDLDLTDGLVEMDVDPRTEIACEVARVVQEADRSQRKPPHPPLDLDPSGRGPVSRSVAGCIVLEGVQPVLRVGAMLDNTARMPIS